MSDASNNGTPPQPRAIRDEFGRLLPGSNLNPKGSGKNRPTITELVKARLAELAESVPYAKTLCEKLSRDPAKTTVAECVVDALLIAGLRGKGEILLALIQRIEPQSTKIDIAGSIDLSAAVARIQTVLGMPTPLRVIEAEDAPQLPAGESEADNAA